MDESSTSLPEIRQGKSKRMSVDMGMVVWLLRISVITHVPRPWYRCPSSGLYQGMKGAEEKTEQGGGESMAVVTMKQLLEAGVHFGHQTRRWNPKMKPYIFTERNGIYIIDLQKTVKMMEDAYAFVRDVVADGGTVLFVGTKKQAQNTIREEAERCGMFYVNVRWLGGMLTNFQTIRKRVQRLQEIEDMEADGSLELRPNKEVLQILKEKEKLEKFLGGVREMTELPDAVFVVDPRKERIAVQEARKLNIPIVAIVDTNCDPDEVDYIIHGNDDAIRAIKLICGKISDAVIEGLEGMDAGVEESASPVGEIREDEIAGEIQDSVTDVVEMPLDNDVVEIVKMDDFNN